MENFIFCAVLFLTNLPIFNPLKTTESQIFSDVVKGHEMGTWARNVSNQKA